MNITLYGAASDRIDEKYVKAVEDFGAEMAKRGHTMVFGAGATGLMGAAARGVHQAGGYIIGVTPHFMHTMEPISELCTELVATETMAERKALMEDKADAFVIVPGGVGTLDEFYQILTLRVLHRHEKPIILYNIDGFWNSTLAVIKEGVDKGFISPEALEDFVLCDTPEEVFDILEK
jgi:uncharacterized protein (TIGR00730 family)